MKKLPIYVSCHSFETKNEQAIDVYKIDVSNVDAHPFQLFRLKKNGSGDWENLSVYASVEDAVMVLLKELFSHELAEEINHGQATVNPSEIVAKINLGERSVAIYSSAKNEMFRLNFDVDFEDMVDRK